MADVTPQFETQDNEGVTKTFSGSVTTAGVLLPDPAISSISSVLIVCSADQNKNNRLEIALDGTNYDLTLSPGGFIEWDMKGEIDQVSIRAESGTVDYQAVINMEPS